MAKTKPTKTDKKQPKDEGSKLIADNSSVEIILEWSVVEPAYQRAIQKLSKNLKTDGFRKGKVPKNIAEQMIGRERLINATLEDLIPDRYREAIEKGNFKPLTQPDFKPKSIEWDKDWVIEAQFAEKPDVSAKGYAKIAAKARKETETEIAKHEKEESKKEGHAHEHSAEQKREQLLHGIYRALIEQYQPAIPELLIHEQTRQDLQNLSQQLKQVNASIDQYLERRNQSFEDLTQEMAAQALGKLQLEFIIEDIANQAKIKVSDTDIEQEYDRLMQGSGKEAEKKDTKKADKPALSPEMKRYLSQSLERKKLMDHLLEVK